MSKDLTVKDVIDTMTQEQKNTLCFYIRQAFDGKVKMDEKLANIESFDKDQQKVFYFLVGCALEKSIDLGVLEIVIGE